MSMKHIHEIFSIQKFFFLSVQASNVNIIAFFILPTNFSNEIIKCIASTVN